MASIPKQVQEYKTLAVRQPQLSLQWHPTNNGSLSPSDVSEFSNRKVWWKCDKGPDHEWQAIIANRSKGIGCPICSGQKIVVSNCLVTLAPKLASQWHPTKNGKLTPYDVGLGSKKKVWWKCDLGADHEWQAAIANRSRGAGCPVCCNQKTVNSNCLATLKPQLASEWHPTKNGKLTPYDVSPGSKKKVWWKCEKGPDHEWQAAVLERANGTGCSVCAGKKIVTSNSLAVLRPALAKEWHPTKNGKLTPYDVAANSHRKVWWKCDEGPDHEWQAVIANRSKGIGCAVCTGKKIVVSNCLATLSPVIASEWHPTKNGKLTPYDVGLGSKKIVWWKCDKGSDHEWKARVDSRITGNGCSVCGGKTIVPSNSLYSLNPGLASEWHPTNNGTLTPHSVGEFSHEKIWWQCKNNPEHEWRVTVANRSWFKTGCPYCTLTPQSKQELTITFELKLFFKIDPRGFKTRIDHKMVSVDIYISEFNLGIKFDGSFWHKGKRELDMLKTTKLRKQGFDIMRIREEPLKPTSPIDIVSAKPFNAKAVTTAVLQHIMNSYSVNENTMRKIEKYMSMNDLQNEDALNRYIEMRLSKKSPQAN